MMIKQFNFSVWSVFMSLFLVLYVGCGNSDVNEDTTTSESVSTVDVTPSAGEGTDGMEIHLENGTSVVQMQVSSSVIQLGFDGQRLQGVQKGEKRKYSNPSGRVVAEVKSGGADGFKLRNPDGSLRWKVKLYEGRVKISDNEENENPWQIRSSEGKFKVKNAGGDEVGRIEQEGEKALITSSEHHFESGASARLSMGVLLLTELSQQDQMILMAELQARGY